MLNVVGYELCVHMYVYVHVYYIHVSVHDSVYYSSIPSVFFCFPPYCLETGSLTESEGGHFGLTG